MAGTGARDGLDGPGRGYGVARDLEDADQIRSEVRGDNELLGRVENCLMKMRGILAVWNGAGSRKRVGLLQLDCQVLGVLDGEGLE